jgi:hypothetical protein
MEKKENEKRKFVNFHKAEFENFTKFDEIWKILNLVNFGKFTIEI